MTCRHETCEEPKSSGRVYCETHYWAWRQPEEPDHLLHERNRLVGKIADAALAVFEIQWREPTDNDYDNLTRAHELRDAYLQLSVYVSYYKQLVNQLEAE